MAPQLAYWDIRGLAEPIRLLLIYTGTEFDDKRYVTGEAPTFDKSCWFDIKFSLGLDFPNLPYYIDGDVKLTQTNAILRHLGRKHGLDGNTDVEKRRVDLTESEVTDFRNGFVNFSYRSSDIESAKPGYLADVEAKFGQFVEFLGDRPWFAGDNLTYPDFHMYEMLASIQKLSPETVAKYPKLVEFMKRFEGLPKVSEYLTSEKYLKTPMNNRMAKFGQTA